MIKLKKLKSAIISSAVAATAFVSPLAAVTPSLSANAADGDNYAKLLQYSLYFYDANMCGNNSDCALSWRGNCHTDDEVPGGFHDAGDHVMFGQPQGYTAATLGWAYYEFKDAFDATGQTAHLKVITDKFAKFFRDATVLNGNSVSKVLIEKGEGNTDHQYWGAPETQGDRGRMLWSTGGAANVTAEYAAALAANYVNFGNPDDLTYAKALYDFSKQNPATYSCEFYGSGESGSADELAWAAGWLYLATKDEGYLNDLKNGPLGYWVMNWENVSLGAGVLLGSITGDWSHAPELGNLSGDGYKFYDKWGSARHNATAQMCSLVAAKHGKG
ncbi:MAG: glycoside hydrolase family 9 protein, partial [Ruminococcus sp.]|uniref:glycoside hydrolase family 9 protein n=1 Tax=Ruminococcus sp. TaxID=41978 RepID=UPI0025D0136F